MVHPAGKRFLLRKSSNAENLPPSFSNKKAEVLASAREASRRRRARVVSGSVPLKVKKVVLNAQRRASKAQRAGKLAQAAAPCTPMSFAVPRPQPLEAVCEAIKSTPGVAEVCAQEKTPLTSDLLHFPRFLRRPPPQVWPAPIRREYIDACDPLLANVPLEYIREGLEVTGEACVFLSHPHPVRVS